jgi:hypothetical protein
MAEAHRRAARQAARRAEPGRPTRSWADLQEREPGFKPVHDRAARQTRSSRRARRTRQPSTTHSRRSPWSDRPWLAMRPGSCSCSVAAWGSAGATRRCSSTVTSGGLRAVRTAHGVPAGQRTRDLYPALPDSPLPAVITCIATTAEARHAGLARQLVEAVCDDLAVRGFTAVETTRRSVPTRRHERRHARVLGVARLRPRGRRRAVPVMRRDLT